LAVHTVFDKLVLADGTHLCYSVASVRRRRLSSFVCDVIVGETVLLNFYTS